MNISNRKPTSLFGHIALASAFIFFLPLILFISLYILLESGAPIFIRRRLDGFGDQEDYVFEFRISTQDRVDACLNAKRTRFGNFLYGSELYLLPALMNSVFGWGPTKLEGRSANFRALKG
jgi:lipopolysaccharide/colanic/teichoic acid biosynthesis glycosyltransferase